MKALVWEAPRALALRELERPRPAAGEVLVQVAAVGICGSELEGYLGENSLRRPPLVMGHEFCGVVVEHGPGVAGPALGTRVTVNPLYGCGECERCRNGANHLCGRRILVGAHRAGAFADFVAVPARVAHPLPEKTPDRLGALCEPTAVCLHALRRAGFQAGERVAIWGAGALGTIAAQVALAHGAAEVSVLDTNPKRLEAARQLGVHRPINAAQASAGELWPNAEDRPGIVLECVGRSVTRQAAARALAPGGRLILLGLHDVETPLPWNELIRLEVSVLCSFAYAEQDFARAVEFVAAGRLKAGDWLSTDVLASGPDWFQRMTSGPVDVTKVVLTV
ncbi:MAG TPA: alcohol dehydrogenase catalytic domain-containing protein [Limnochordia bacterium]|nr:alcohol dehydrogenase catalytic domain-containing protein [Limnochordia bacterium]